MSDCAWAGVKPFMCAFLLCALSMGCDSETTKNAGVMHDDALNRGDTTPIDGSVAVDQAPPLADFRPGNDAQFDGSYPDASVVRADAGVLVLPYCLTPEWPSAVMVSKTQKRPAMTGTR